MDNGGNVFVRFRQKNFQLSKTIDTRFLAK